MTDLERLLAHHTRPHDFVQPANHALVMLVTPDGKGGVKLLDTLQLAPQPVLLGQSVTVTVSATKRDFTFDAPEGLLSVNLTVKGTPGQ